jgi:hypothetical protein
LSDLELASHGRLTKVFLKVSIQFPVLSLFKAATEKADAGQVAARSAGQNERWNGWVKKLVGIADHQQLY